MKDLILLLTLLTATEAKPEAPEPYFNGSNNNDGYKYNSPQNNFVDGRERGKLLSDTYLPPPPSPSASPSYNAPTFKNKPSTIQVPPRLEKNFQPNLNSRSNSIGITNHSSNGRSSFSSSSANLLPPRSSYLPSFNESQSSLITGASLNNDSLRVGGLYFQNGLPDLEAVNSNDLFDELPSNSINGRIWGKGTYTFIGKDGITRGIDGELMFQATGRKTHKLGAPLGSNVMATMSGGGLG